MRHSTMSEISSVSQSPQVDAGTATQRYLTETDQSLLGHIDANDTSSLVPMIQVSGVCNLKCTMCGGARELVPGKFMEPDLFMTVCDKLQADHVKSIIIAGAYGEPFLHP